MISTNRKKMMVLMDMAFTCFESRREVFIREFKQEPSEAFISFYENLKRNPSLIEKEFNKRNPDFNGYSDQTLAMLLETVFNNLGRSFINEKS